MKILTELILTRRSFMATLLAFALLPGAGYAAGSKKMNANVNVAVGGRISGRDIIFFQQQGAEFAGGGNGEGMA